jgi:hypothetical protein
MSSNMDAMSMLLDTPPHRFWNAEPRSRAFRAGAFGEGAASYFFLSLRMKVTFMVTRYSTTFPF